MKKTRRASTNKKRRARAPARRRTNRKRSRQISTTPGKPLRWNPDPEDVQRSVIKLVLSLVEFIRKLMERQAIRRLDEGTLTPREIEDVGLALMKLEQTVRLLAKRFDLSPHDLNLDLGPVGRLH